MNRTQATDAVRELLSIHARERDWMDDIHAAMRPWTPGQAASKFAIGAGSAGHSRQIEIAQASQTNYLPLILDVFSQSLKVKGFYSSEAKESSSWQWWLRNKMNARQTGLHRSTLQYGTGYAAVSRGGDDGYSPVISLASPRQMVALYGEDHYWPGADGVSTEWPIIAAEIKQNRVRLWDEERVYFFGAKHVPSDPRQWDKQTWNNTSNLEFIESRRHNIGVVPIVRYQDRMLLDGEEQHGIIEPLVSMQKRLDMTNWEQGNAQWVSAFKQRYVVGWAPKDETTQASMKASDTWFINADGSKAKVGQFEETDFTGYTESKASTLRDLTAIAQIPPQMAGANAISNVSADGLAGMENARDNKSSEIRTSVGESHEQLLRLAAHVAGNTEDANDFTSEIAWEDLSSRSFAQWVDGLGKLSTMLGIPAEVLLEDVPGWSREKVQRVKAAIKEQPDQDTIPTGRGLFQ
ncbi:phage portal protein [Corynebacteriaceae bacterium 6-324]